MINFNDPQIWVAIAFVLFFISCGKLVWANIKKILDHRINEIDNEIIEAHKLHNDAKVLLSNEMKKFQDLEKNIQLVLKEGKLRSQELVDEYRKNMEIEISKLEKVSIEKIKYLEAQAITELKNKIANLSIKVTEEFFLNEFKNDKQLENINIAINEIDNTLKTEKNII